MTGGWLHLEGPPHLQLLDRKQGEKSAAIFPGYTVTSKKLFFLNYFSKNCLRLIHGCDLYTKTYGNQKADHLTKTISPALHLQCECGIKIKEI